METIFSFLPSNSNFYIYMGIMSVLTQVICTIYGLRLLALIRKLRLWVLVWIPYVTGCGLITMRRSTAVYRYIRDCPVNNYGVLFLENLMQFIISILFTLFSVKLYNELSKYFEHGELKHIPFKGDKGDKGEKGDKGDKGEKGDKGDKGE